MKNKQNMEDPVIRRAKPPVSPPKNIIKSLRLKRLNLTLKRGAYGGRCFATVGLRPTLTGGKALRKN